MDDGRLLDYLMNHDELMEEKIAFYIRDTMEALQYLHNCRVAHLDIKVRKTKEENINLCLYSLKYPFLLVHLHSKPNYRYARLLHNFNHLKLS